MTAIDARLSRDGACLHVDDAGGTGEPAYFQHGLCGDARQTAEVFPDGGRFRRVTLECRGHGRSEAGDPGTVSIAGFCDDLAALVETGGTVPAVVGGISMGAAVSLRLAVRRPDLVRALVLARPAWVADAAPANMAPNAEVGRLLATLPADEARRRFLAGATAARLGEEAPDNLASLVGFFDRRPQDVTAALLQAISADGPGVTPDEVARLPVPVLVLGHGRDVVHPMAHAEALAAMIPGARLVAITPKAEDRGRYVAEFRSALSGFLEDLP